LKLLSLGYYGLVLFTPQYFDLITNPETPAPSIPPPIEPPFEAAPLFPPSDGEPILEAPIQVVAPTPVNVNADISVRCVFLFFFL
jgi:hypothetical protein